MATATQTEPKTARQKAEDGLKHYAELEAQIAENRASIKVLEETKSEVKAWLQEWADDHAAEFEGKKMLVLESGSIGYKLEAKTLVWDTDKTPEGYEAKLLKLVKEELPAAVEEVVNKKALLNGFELLPTLRKKLEKLGGYVRQDDQFVVSAKKITG